MSQVEMLKGNSRYLRVLIALGTHWVISQKDIILITIYQS